MAEPSSRLSKSFDDSPEKMMPHRNDINIEEDEASIILEASDQDKAEKVSQSMPAAKSGGEIEVE